MSIDLHNLSNPTQTPTATTVAALAPQSRVGFGDAGADAGTKAMGKAGRNADLALSLDDSNQIRCVSCNGILHSDQNDYDRRWTIGHVAVPQSLLGCGKSKEATPLAIAYGLTVDAGFKAGRSFNTGVQCGFCNNLQGHTPGAIAFYDNGCVITNNVGKSTPSGGTILPWGEIEARLLSRNNRCRQWLTAAAEGKSFKAASSYGKKLSAVVQQRLSAAGL